MRVCPAPYCLRDAPAQCPSAAIWASSSFAAANIESIVSSLWVGGLHSECQDHQNLGSSGQRPRRETTSVTSDRGSLLLVPFRSNTRRPRRLQDDAGHGCL